ncbi:MAG: site-specific integrase [Microthrixaceae bacterium]|nr:site-specific integrase [Microthrixaceae bacterium]MCO5305123.1 site-specific integrase [Microthrixaceae bacterium]HNH37460.1 tyrosine-type recombinase/integrase [Microthrixaceae bacterium]
MQGSKRKGRRPGTWELRVDAGEDPLTRKRQQKSVTFHGTSRQADVALAELITKSARGQVSVGQRTVAHAIEAGLRQAELEGLEPTTLRSYRTSAECHVLPALGSRRLSHLSAEHLDRFYGALVEAGYSRSTVRGCHVLLCRVLDQAKRWGWVAVNVGRDARPPRQHTSNPKPVPIDVARAMIDEAVRVNPTLAMLSVLAADTGARRGELCALRWRHVNVDAGTLRIEAAIGETNVVYEKDTKTHQHRTVTLSSFALDWLLDHRDRHAKACALCGIELSNDACVLAPEPGGLKPLHPSSATRAFSRLRGRMELPSWIHLHGLRHLQVTQLLDAGIPLRSVSGRVGHRNPSTTTNIYAHWIQESDAHSAKVVGGRIWGSAERGQP